MFFRSSNSTMRKLYENFENNLSDIFAVSLELLNPHSIAQTPSIV